MTGRNEGDTGATACQERDKGRNAAPRVQEINPFFFYDPGKHTGRAKNRPRGFSMNWQRIMSDPRRIEKIHQRTAGRYYDCLVALFLQVLRQVHRTALNAA